MYEFTDLPSFDKINSVVLARRSLRVKLMAKSIKQHKAYNFNVASDEAATYELKHHGGSWLIVSSNESVRDIFNLTLIQALNILLKLEDAWYTRVDLRTPID